MSNGHTSAIQSNNAFLHLKNILLPQEWDKLFSSPKVDFLKRGLISKQNNHIDTIPIVFSGLVKLSKEVRRDKNMIIRVVKPGSFIGLSAAFDTGKFEYSTIALDNTSVGFVNVETLKQVMSENSAFNLEIIRQISRDSVMNTNRLTSLLHKQLPGRVADIILYFSEEIYEKQCFSLPLTRQELAELAGTTKESLIRTLSEFKHDKIIDTQRNQITIKSIDIIKTLSRLG